MLNEENLRTEIIQTKYGKISGLIVNLNDDEKFEIFLGIEYAKQPIGTLRNEVCIFFA